MRLSKYIFILFVLITNSALSQSSQNVPPLENPVSVEFLQNNLPDYHPRLGLTPQLVTHIKQELENDPVVRNVYQAFQLNADQIMKQPLLKRKLQGRRLLSVSREMLYRMNILAMLYALEKDTEILQRIDKEVVNVCNFKDWNPSHFLDVAEMSLAVAIAIDWTGEDLPSGTIRLARDALMEKGIRPSYQDNPGGPDWVRGGNNWNQVCHAGMVAAAIATAEDEPELAAQTISRALEGMPYALAAYMPDGVYPEGSSYWSYGTSFSVMTAAMFRSAFDTDFGLSEYPAFKESAKFRWLSIAPSGMYFNFADCGDKRSKNGDFTLAWFAKETGIADYYEKERFLMDPQQMGELSRQAGFGLLWLAQIQEDNLLTSTMPTAWKGDGENPIVIFRSPEGDSLQYYFGGKGGKGTVNHGNMDAGSFVFELGGIRWVIDPGNQPYHELEKAGFGLWSKCQTCDRWKLLTKNNFGHSTLTINGQLHVANGMAEIVEFSTNPQPEASVDLTPVFGDVVNFAQRTFTRDSKSSLLISDSLEVNDKTETVTWQLMTTSEIEINDTVAVLKQAGQQLIIENLSHPDIGFSKVNLDPPPFKLDKEIEGLKRLELKVPSAAIKDEKRTIRVRIKRDQ